MADDHELKGRFWISSNGQYFAGKGRYELLKNIKETGSLTAAAKLMKMSYKAAWDSVQEMNSLADEPLLSASVGGKKGGGTVLTAAGIKFLETYENYNNIFDNAINYMQALPFMPEGKGTIQATPKDSHYLYSSADNCLKLTVSKVKTANNASKVTLNDQFIIITATLSHIPFLKTGDIVEVSFNKDCVEIKGEIFPQSTVGDIVAVEEFPNYNLISIDIGASYIIKASAKKSAPFSQGMLVYFKIDPTHIIITKY